MSEEAIDRSQSRTLASLTSKIGSGATPRGGEAAYLSSGVPFIRSMNVHFDGIRWEGLAHIGSQDARQLDGATVREGDVLLNITGASIGRVTIAPAKLAGARVNQHVCILRPTAALDARYLAAYFRSPDQQALIASEESGATRQALTKAKLEQWRVPCPDLEDQQSIVAHLDACFGRTKRAKKALDEVPALLDRLRQSILAAAFRGDLTADWRAENPDVEPASDLLKRIRVERRRRWEEAELAKMIAKGKAPKDDKWKAKYEEPEPVDESELPELPDGWCWAAVEELCTVPVRTGLSLRGSDVPPGTPCLRLDALREASVDFDCVRYAPVQPSDVEDVLVEVDDFLVSRGNGSLRLLARGSRVTSNAGPTMFPDTAFRLRWHPEIRDWACLVWSSQGVRSQVERAAKTTAGIHKITQTNLNRFVVPLAPAAEQEQVTAGVAEVLGRASTAKVEHAAAAELLCDLERTVLRTAFSDTGLRAEARGDDRARRTDQARSDSSDPKGVELSDPSESSRSK